MRPSSSRTESPIRTRIAIASTIVLAIGGLRLAKSFSSGDERIAATYRDSENRERDSDGAAARALSETNTFYTAKQIGYAGHRAPIADPLEALERSERRIEHATWIVNRGTPAGTLYGLLLLRHSDAVRFASLEGIAQQRHGNTLVFGTDGCSLEQRSFSDWLGSIRSGSLDLGICFECRANRESEH